MPYTYEFEKKECGEVILNKTPRKFKWKLPSLFGRHHVRSRFYHLVSIVFLISSLLWFVDVLPDKVYSMLSFVLFFLDYIAEMYDPHPENPGPWFKSHFHRFFDNEEN